MRTELHQEVTITMSFAQANKLQFEIMDLIDQVSNDPHELHLTTLDEFREILRQLRKQARTL